MEVAISGRTTEVLNEKRKMSPESVYNEDDTCIPCITMSWMFIFRLVNAWVFYRKTERSECIYVPYKLCII
jgi:hypothetical protein